MEKHFIVFLKAPDNRKLLTTAKASGEFAVLIEEPKSEKVKSLARISTIAPDGDYKLGEDFVTVEIKGKEDEERAAELLRRGKKVIVKTTDWSIIPLENLLAQGDDVYAWVKSAQEAKIAVKILEKGVKGVVLDSEDMNEIKAVGEAIVSSGEAVKMETARIKSIKPVGMCDRVCIDTCTNMKRGEGVLVGNSSAGMFLVHAETESNPYVAPRPFRVNAGAVHMYVKVPGGKTRYLSEIEAGTEVVVYDHTGAGRVACVGRAKVEKRPMLLVSAQTSDGKPVSAVLQNAETIRLTKPDGTPVSVVELKEGDEVLAYTEEPGRHFGMKVKETIQEK